MRCLGLWGSQEEQDMRMRRLIHGGCCAAILTTAFLFLACDSFAQDGGESQLQSLIDSGEFPAALQMAKNFEADQADKWLGKISQQQFSSGAQPAAFKTAGQLKSDRNRATLLTGLFRNNTFNQYGAGDNTGAGSDQWGGGFNNPPNNVPGGQGGGVTVQDFQPLIDLIKSTVAPDDWDDTNGDGTITPYLAGVYVDAEGTVKKIRATKNSALDRIRMDAVSDSGNRETAFTSNLRKVSLTKLEKAAQLLAAQGKPVTEDMRNLAGIYQIEYLMVYPESGDVVIAGPAGPWSVDNEGRRVNTKTGKPVLQLDDLVVCLRNAWYQNAKFGCTIDPRQKNLAATKKFVATSKLRGNAWRQQLRSVLGQQDIKVFGIDSRTHAGQVLVEADYRMKLVGMGLEPSIAEVPSYLARIKLLADGSLPPMDVVRWWFTLNYKDVVADKERTVFSFRGPGVKVLSENEMVNELGQRIHTGKSDAMTGEFAKDFTRHFDQMADTYPVYRQLKNVFDLAIVSALVKHQGLASQTDWNLTYFGEPNEDELTYQPALSHAPKTVDSVMNHRIIKQRKKSSTVKHTVVGVSGGIEFDAMKIAHEDLIKTDLDGELKQSATLSKPQSDHWWWD